MKKLKKVTALALSAAMILMTGCTKPVTMESSQATTAAPESKASEAAPQTTDAGGSQEPVTIRFSWWGGESRQKATLAAVDAFMKEYPWITVECEYSA